MKLSKFRIKNYRNFIDTGLIELDFSQGLVPIIGKNNIGKTNLISAICLGMNTIQEKGARGPYHNRVRCEYDFDRDFPISVEKNENNITKISLYFALDECDKNEIKRSCFDFDSDEVSYEIEFNAFGRRIWPNIEVSPSINHPEGDFSLIKYFASKLDVNHISATRSIDGVNREIFRLIESEIGNNKEISRKYESLTEEAYQIEEPILEKVCRAIVDDLKEFYSDINSIDMERNRNERLPLFYRTARGYNLILDDGIRTSLDQKSDGIINLVEIALIKHSSELGVDNNLILAIEEPEAHLHTGAVYNLKETLDVIAKNYQVIYSTHSPILAATEVSSNLIVEKSKNHVGESVVRRAKDKHDIGVALGMRSEESFFYLPNLILLVEGSHDREYLKKILPLFSRELSGAFENEDFVIQAVNGASKFIENIRLIASSFTSSYYCLFDYDEAGRREAKNLSDKKVLAEDQYYFTRVRNKISAEFEDWLDEEILYEAIELNCGDSILCAFKKTLHSISWSERLDKVLMNQTYNKNEIEIKLNAVKLTCEQIVKEKAETDWKKYIQKDAWDSFSDFSKAILKKSTTN
jgi:hypothetical protein